MKYYRGRSSAIVLINKHIVQLVYFMWNQVKISALRGVEIRMWREPPGGGCKTSTHVIAMLLFAVLALTTGESTSYEKISFTPRFLAWLVDNYEEALTDTGHAICVYGKVFVDETCHDFRFVLLQQNNIRYIFGAIFWYKYNWRNYTQNIDLKMKW